MYETSHHLRKYQCFFSSGPLHYCNGPYFLEMAHNFGNPGAIGPNACFAFPISVPVTCDLRFRPAAFKIRKKNITQSHDVISGSVVYKGTPNYHLTRQSTHLKIILANFNWKTLHAKC